MSEPVADRHTETHDPSNAIYGTIISAGLLAAEGKSDVPIGLIAISAFSTLVVFWLAHAYSRLVIGGAGTGSLLEVLRATLRFEWPIVPGGAIPIVALLIATAIGMERSNAILTSLVVAMAVLIVEAHATCRRLELSTARHASYLLLAGMLGAAVIALKVAIH